MEECGCRSVIAYSAWWSFCSPEVNLTMRIGAITRDVLRRAAATGATPLSLADGIVRARIRRDDARHLRSRDRQQA